MGQLGIGQPALSRRGAAYVQMPTTVEKMWRALRAAGA